TTWTKTTTRRIGTCSLLTCGWCGGRTFAPTEMTRERPRARKSSRAATGYRCACRADNASLANESPPAPPGETCSFEQRRPRRRINLHVISARPVDHVQRTAVHRRQHVGPDHLRRRPLPG